MMGTNHEALHCAVYSSTLFSDTLSLRPFLNVGDQVSHQCKTRGKHVVPRVSLYFWVENGRGRIGVYFLMVRVLTPRVAQALVL